MRKIYSFFLAALTAIAANATDYNVPITINVNGGVTEQSALISVEENNGLYNLTLKNFILQSGTGPIGVGNVELNDIESYQDGDATLLLASRNVTITSGDDPSVLLWMGTFLPPVPVELRGKIEGDNLCCYLDIDLTATLQQTVKVAVGSGYQIPNPSFESWHTSTGSYMEPNAWHSFESATGSMATLAGHHITKSDDAHTGEASARIYATSIFGVVANGTMTTGRMNAGSVTASSTANHAFLDMSKDDVDGNGDPFYVTLQSRPDSIAVWMKYKQGTPNANHPYATISAVITDGTRYQDPEDNTYTNVVARAKNNTIATTDGNWVRITAPFVYTDNNVAPKAILVTISTNADAGQGSANDEVLVDDIELVYNANVTGLKVNGLDVTDFGSDKTEYEVVVNKDITADDIEVTVEGYAHVAKKIEVNGDTSICSIFVISADMSSEKCYVVKISKSDSAICEQLTAPNQPTTYFTLDGRQANTLEPGKIYINRQTDGTVRKIRQ
jgi:hypothetical protein